MTIFWTELAAFEIPPPAPPPPFSSPWMTIVDYLRDATHLQIKAEGSWTQGAITCGPDGLIDVKAQADPLAIPGCPVGALIGKIGGSSAMITTAPAPGGGAVSGDRAGDAEGSAGSAGPAEGKAFAIGAHCVVKVPAKSIGPLFISFNGLKRPVTITRLKVIVAGAILP